MAERTSQWAVVVEHALGGRLHAGERFLRALPRLFPESLHSVDLAVRGRPRLLMALVRFQGGLTIETEARWAFWAHRAQASVQDLERLGKRDRAHFLARFASSEHRAQGVLPSALPSTLAQLLQQAQVRGDTPVPDVVGPALSLRVGPGRDTSTWEPGPSRLFVPSAVLPPLGERMALSLHVGDEGFSVQALVSEVFAPGRHASAPGFHLELLTAEPRLTEALRTSAVDETALTTPPERRIRPTHTPVSGARGEVGRPGTPAPTPRASSGTRSVESPPPSTPVDSHRPLTPPLQSPAPSPPASRPPPPPRAPEASEASIQRASPRFRLHAPVQIERVSTDPLPEVRMDYASGQAFAEEWIDNLSLGGAFVRTPKPLPMFTSLRLDIHLPGRVLPPVPAKVVRVLPQGMGVQFELDARTRDALEEALEKLAARPRRALVALSSEALRSWAKEALLGRGFEVRTVPDAARALGVLLEDAPWLDVLVIEASMHPASGRSLVRMVREEGGEQDLTLVALAAPGEAERWVAAGLGQGLDVVAEQGVAPELFSSRIEDAIAKRQLGPIAQPLVLNAPASEATERLVLRYETAEALRAAAEVLRMGGAFVFTPAPPAQGTTVQLAIELPGGAVLLTEAEVVSEEAAGVGVAFRLEGPSRAALEAALAEVGVEPEPSASKATPSSTDAGGRAGTPGMGSAREVSAPDASRVGSERVPPPVPLASMPPAFQTLLEEEPSNIYGPRVGPFTLLSMLGRGGVAEVHFARALSGPLMGQHVALKRLLAHAARDARFVELFAGEADVTRMLEHPNLVKTLAVGIDGELPWMAMEVVDGCDLGQLLGHARRAGALLPVSYVVGVVHSLLGALDYVHGASGLTGEPLHLVHSDISPANVFVTRDGVVKLGDFGVARARGVELDVAGKAHYLSPDAISGRLEPGVDLWATAVLLYELLTLQRPFDGPDPDAVLTAVRKRRYVRARKLRPDLPADLDRLLERAFSPRARKHFQSAREMADALSSWIGTPESMQRTLAEHTRKLLAQARTVA